MSHQLSFLASSLNASEPGIPGISAVIKHRLLRAQLAPAAGEPFPEPSVLFIDLLGQKPFKRSLRGSDAISETSSVGHIEDLEKMDPLEGAGLMVEYEVPELRRVVGWVQISLGCVGHQRDFNFALNETRFQWRFLSKGVA